MNVLIAAPVRSRAWILPEYLKALTGLNYSPKKLSFYFIENDSSDGSLDILTKFKEENIGRYRSIEVESVSLGDAPVDTRSDGARINRNPIYPRLVELRNRILHRGQHYDFVLSVDTDIIVPPHTILSLMATASKGVCGGLVRNSVKNPKVFNFMYNVGSYMVRINKPDISKAAEPFQVGMTGAVALYSRRACEVGKFSRGLSGEDEGFCRSVIGHGLTVWVDPTVKCSHVMAPNIRLECP